MPLNPQIPLMAGQNRLARRDPMKSTLQAMQIAQAQEQMLASREAREQKNMLRNMLAQGGSLEDYARMTGDPDMLLKLRKDKREGRIKDIDYKVKSTEYLLDQLNYVNSPQAWNAWRNEVAQVSPEFAQRLPAQGSPDTVRQIQMMGISLLDRLKLDQSERRTRAAEQGKYGTQVNVNQTYSPLTKKQLNEQQGAITKSIGFMGNVSRIRELYDPAMLTIPVKLRNVWTSAKSKAGGLLGDVTPQERKALTQWTGFRTGVEQSFNQYRKEITGAAASVQELERLKTSMFNTDMDPISFEAALNEYERTLQRGYRIAQRLIREGVPVGSDEFATMHDRYFKLGEDDDANVRGNQLMQEGKTKEEAYRILQSEGYSG